MRFGDAVEFAWTGLLKRRLRTFLTVAGVTIGIGALVAMISFGKGLQKNVTRAFKSSDLFTTVVVMPGGAEPPGGDPDERRRPAEPAPRPDAALDGRAVAAISRLPGVRQAYPDISFPAVVGFGGAEVFRLVRVLPASALGAGSSGVKWGRPYASDAEEGVVVSRSLLRQLGRTDPAAAVGRTLRLGSVYVDIARLASFDIGAILSGGASPVSSESYEFPIVGVTDTMEFGGGGGLTEASVVIPPGPAGRIKRLPFTSVWDLFRMRNGKPGYSAVTVKIGSLRDLEAVRSGIRGLGFATFALADQFAEITRAFFFMDMILAAVGMIAIVVAALGIVNTMVMSILERYREIGIMKAVGAADRDIRRIFFFESGAIGLAGGAAGCVLGWATSLLVNRIVNLYLAGQGLPFVRYFAFPAWIFLGAAGFSLLVSLVSGVYPARRAARVDPVVALRHD